MKTDFNNCNIGNVVMGNQTNITETQEMQNVNVDKRESEQKKTMKENLSAFASGTLSSVAADAISKLFNK